MTTDTKVDLQRVYTQEERDAMFDAYIEALENDDHEEAERILEHMPIGPQWARIFRDILGKDVLVENFNITEATRVLGEGWLDGK